MKSKTSYLSRLKAHYGTTHDPSLGGYLLPDGSFLDFSEGSGQRIQDHRNITWVSVIEEKPNELRYDVMARICRTVGMYRWMPESWALETWTKPTSDQISTLRDLFKIRSPTLEMHRGTHRGTDSRCVPKVNFYLEYEEWERDALKHLVSFYASKIVE